MLDRCRKTFSYRQILVLLPLILVGFSVVAKDYYNFDQEVINAPFNISHDPIIANLLPKGGDEIILLGELDGAHKLAIYSLDSVSAQYIIQVYIDIPDSTFRYDISEKDALGNQGLYFLTSDSIMQFSPTSETNFEHVVDVSSMYINNKAEYLKRAKFIKDLNGDKLIDIVLPDFNKINLYINQQEGQFSEFKLPVSPIVEIFESSVSYTEQAYYFIDMNLDGRKDIVIAEDGELLVFSQSEQGDFSIKPMIVSVNDTISGVDWWNARGVDGQNVDQSDLEHRTLEHIRDVNNDGLPDLVVQFTQSSGVLDKSNDYEIYFGESVNDKIQYNDKANSIVKADGTLTDLDFIDINSDQQDEIITSSFDIGVSQIIGALVTGSIDQDVLLFSLGNDVSYKQVLKKEVQLTFSLSSGKSGSPVVKMADLDGDGYKELILSASEKKLKVYPGQASKPMLKKSPQNVKLYLPKDGEMLTFSDINTDGREELIVRYSSDDGADKHKQLLILSTSNKIKNK